MKVVLLVASLMRFILWRSKETKLKDGSRITRSIIDEFHFLDIQRDQMEGEIGVTGSIIDELDSSDIQGDQMQGESGVTRRINDQLHSSHIQGD